MKNLTFCAVSSLYLHGQESMEEFDNRIRRAASRMPTEEERARNNPIQAQIAGNITSDPKKIASRKRSPRAPKEIDN